MLYLVRDGNAFARCLSCPYNSPATGSGLTQSIWTTLNKIDVKRSSPPRAVSHNHPTGNPDRRRPTLDPSRQSRTRRSKSPAKRAQKRVNLGDEPITRVADENSITVNTSSQRPQRTVIPSRRVPEAFNANAKRIHNSQPSRSTNSTQQMDIDTNTSE